MVFQRFHPTWKRCVEGEGREKQNVRRKPAPGDTSTNRLFCSRRNPRGGCGEGGYSFLAIRVPLFSLLASVHGRGDEETTLFTSGKMAASEAGASATVAPTRGRPAARIAGANAWIGGIMRGSTTFTGEPNQNLKTPLSRLKGYCCL